MIKNFLLLLLISSNYVCGELVASVMIFRHGERTPRNFYPKDPYKNNTYWPAPFGELTEVGKTQAYELGKWTRHRYKNFLPERYTSKDFLIYSSGLDRTLSSAAAFVCGLYPVTRQNQLPIQPIPIYSKPKNLDNTIYTGVEPCPKQKLLQTNLLNSNFFKKLNQDNAELYSYLSLYMGMSINSFVGLEDYYDTFWIEKLNNFTLPLWAEQIYPKKLERLAFLNLLLPTYTTDLAKFRIGLLYSEILHYFESFVRDTSEFESDFNMGKKGRKLLAISGHDTNIVALLDTLKVRRIGWPPFSSSVLFELWKGKESQHYVNILYKNGTEIVKIKMEGCGFNSEFNCFVDYLRPISLSPTKFKEECKL